MEKQIFDPEQFGRTLILLKQYGIAQKEKDSGMVQIMNSVDMGRAVVELLSTVPGVSTKGIFEEASKESSFALSDQAIRVILREEGDNTAEMYLTFPSGFPIPDDEYFTLQFDRTDNKTCISLKIKMDSGCFPRSGEISISGVDKNFPFPRHSAKFGQDSTVTEGSSDMNLINGEELNVIKLIAEITSPDNLGSLINPNLIIQKVKPSQLPSHTP